MNKSHFTDGEQDVTRLRALCVLRIVQRLWHYAHHSPERHQWSFSGARLCLLSTKCLVVGPPYRKFGQVVRVLVSDHVSEETARR